METSRGNEDGCYAQCEMRYILPLQEHMMRDGEHLGRNHEGEPAPVHAVFDSLRFRELDTSLGRWSRQDPLGYVDGANLYGAFGTAPQRYVDPSGTDIWLEGPSHNEPAGHISICVGDPLGNYVCYSYGIIIPPKLHDGLPAGEVYFDVDKGGPILEGTYHVTSDTTDREAIEFLDRTRHRRGVYGGFNCRTYSWWALEQCTSTDLEVYSDGYVRNIYNPVTDHSATPPPREVVPQALHRRPISTSTTTSTATSSSTTTTAADSVFIPVYVGFKVLVIISASTSSGGATAGTTGAGSTTTTQGGGGPMNHGGH